jgi:hypothetical protein
VPRTIEQALTLRATPERLYRIYLSPREHSGVWRLGHVEDPGQGRGPNGYDAAHHRQVPAAGSWQADRPDVARIELEARRPRLGAHPGVHAPAGRLSAHKWSTPTSPMLTPGASHAAGTRTTGTPGSGTSPGAELSPLAPGGGRSARAIFVGAISSRYMLVASEVLPWMKAAQAREL